MFDDEDLDIGVRVTLKDAFSAAAAKIEGAWGRLSVRLGGAAAQGVLRLQGVMGGANTVAERLHRTLVGSASVFPTWIALVGGAAVGLHRLIRNTMESGSQIENLEIAFTTMLGSADAARSHLEELQRFAVGKPFEFSQLAESSRTLQTFGFRVGEVTGLLQDMGDAAFVSNTGYRGVQTMTRVFGMMHATGKTTLGHLQQLARAGVPAFEILQQKLGMTGEQLQKIAHSGIPADRVITALREGMRERFAGGMERASRTLTARLSDLSDIAGNFYRTLYKTLGPQLIWFVDLLSNSINGNMSGITKTVTGVVSSVLAVGRILVGVLGGAFGDVRGRWERDANGGLRSVTRMLQNFADIVEAVSVLVSSDNGRGLARIPRSMRENLERKGLWRSTVEFARFFGRVRAFLGGFVEGFSQGMTAAKRALDRMSDALGVSRLAMGTTRNDASRLGERVGKLVVGLIALRYALVAVRAASSALGAGSRGLGSLLQFAAANPILAAVAVAVIAVGAACAYAYTHAEQLSSTAPKWQALRAALDLLAGPLVEVSIFAAQAGTITESWRKRVSGWGKEMRALWTSVKAAVLSFVDRVAGVASAIARPFRIAWAFVVVAAYVAFAKVVQFFAPIVERIRAGAIRLFTPILTAALGLLLRLRTLARQTFAPFLAAAQTVWTYVREAVTQRAFEMYAALRSRTVGIVAALLHIWRGLKAGVASMFDGLLERILAPLRGAARELVSMYQSLPASLRPAGMNDMVNTLAAFGAGRTSEANTATPAAMGGNVVDMEAAGVGAIPATNVAHTAAVASAVRASAASPAVVVNPPPPGPTIVQIDGREIARVVDRQNTTTALRSGRAVETG